MTPELVALAHRAVACKGWRWLPGMLAWRKTHRGERVPVRLVSGVSYAAELLDPQVIESSTEGKVIACSAHAVVDGWHRVEDLIPDLADPATLGCLLALVREAWGDPRAYLCDYGGYDSVEWGVVSHEWDAKRQAEGPKAWFSCLLGDADTEAGALVVALEAANELP